MQCYKELQIDANVCNSLIKSRHLHKMKTTLFVLKMESENSGFEFIKLLDVLLWESKSRQYTFNNTALSVIERL